MPDEFEGEHPAVRNRRQYEEDKITILKALERGSSFKISPEAATALISHFYTIHEFQDRLLRLMTLLDLPTADPSKAGEAHRLLVEAHNQSFVQTNKLLSDFATLAHEEWDETGA